MKKKGGKRERNEKQNVVSRFFFFSRVSLSLSLSSEGAQLPLQDCLLLLLHRTAETGCLKRGTERVGGKEKDVCLCHRFCSIPSNNIFPVMPRTDQGPVRLAANKTEQEFHDALAGTAK